MKWGKPYEQGGKWYQYGTQNGVTYVRQANTRAGLVSAKASRVH